jgi:hypothetical protein
LVEDRVMLNGNKTIVFKSWCTILSGVSS